MSLGNITESGILSWIFRANDVFTNEKYDTIYIGLSSGSVDDDGGNITNVELTGTNYGRVSKTNSTATWILATGTQPTTKYNKVPITFSTPGNDWGTATNFFISTTGVGSGNLIAHGSLFPAKPIYNGDSIEFPVSGLRISVN